MSLIIHSLAIRYELYEKFHSFLNANEYINFDEMFFTGFFVLFVLILFSIRRYLELKKEIALSVIAKEDLQAEMTERFDAEKALKNSEKKYRTLIDQSAEAIYLQEEGKYEIVNNKFLELFGITHKEVCSPDFTILNYTHPKSIPFLKERMRKLKLGKKIPSTYEFSAITKDKQEIEIEASISYIYSNGKLKTQGVLRNISRRKRAESVQSAIYLIAEAANMTDNLDDLIASIHAILKSILNAENFFVELYDEKTSLYTSAYFVDQFDVVEELTMSLEGSLTDYIRRTGKAAIIDEKRHAELVEAGEAKYILKPSKVWMGAPLNTTSGVLGVIAVQSYEDPNLYALEDLELLVLISDQIAIAIEKKKISDEKEKDRQFFKTVINKLANPLYVININDRSIAVANTAAKKLIFKNNLINRSCYKLITDNESCNCSLSSCPIKKLISNRKPIQFEQAIKNDENIEIIYEIFAFPIFDASGEVIQVLENLVDITERKRAERKLIELAVFPEANPNIVMRINRNQEVSYMNTATSNILGEIGVSIHNMHKCLPENFAELIDNMFSEGSGIDDIHVKINGCTIAWSFHPIPGQNKIHCYGHDITRQVQQANEINKLSMVATQSSNIIMITDTEGVIEYVNPYFTFVTGYDKEDVVGVKLSKIKSGKMSEDLYADLWNTILSGSTWNGKIENRKKNGEFYWESKTISPIFNEAGEKTSYISIGNDITNELQIQIKLAESEKSTAIATLAAGVAHEFKNYLGGIIGNASFSLDEIDSEGGLSLAKETLENIIGMGEKANDVAMSLLTFSKAKSEDRKKEDIKKIITQSIKLIEKELAILSIEVALHFDDIPPVEISLSKIQQLLLNLFINAKHAIGTNGVITVALLEKDEFIQIKIGDTGKGIEKENLDRIFDPFFSTKGVWGEDNVSGTGMGLSICRNIAREHKGDLTVDTVIGVGSVFTISIPKSKDSDLVAYKNNDIGKEQNIIFFTLNHSIVSSYHEDACKNNFQLLLVDNFDKIDKSIINSTELVVCDAKFSAKLELYRMVEYCNSQNQPYIMVNCGTMEYQLSELYENSRANYKEIPNFNKVMQDYELALQGKVHIK